jgi:CheY-like chemotaxis protein
MMMPVMDGPALIRALITLNPGAKIIAASGLQAEGKAGQAPHPGVKYSLPKPYTAGTMLELLARALNER